MDITEHIILSHPVVGCSIDCSFCYAKKANDEREHWVEDFSKVQLMPDYKEQLTRYNPAVYMVTGYTDISEWDEQTINAILEVCQDNPQNHYLFLTKRPYDLSFECYLPNCWFGVSVCKMEDKSRIDSLINHRFYHKFIAFEPLLEELGRIDILGKGIEFISISKELGNTGNETPVKYEWVKQILNQTTGIPVLMKSSLELLMGDEYTQQLPLSLKSRIDKDIVSTSYQDVIENT